MDSHRRVVCARCHQVVLICVECYRGQRYCGPECAQASRRRQVREAGRAYQTTERGRAHHAERQREYRRRQAQSQRDGRLDESPSVTHQGVSDRPDPSHARHDAASSPPPKPIRESVRRPSTSRVCATCGESVSAFAYVGLPVREKRSARRDWLRWWARRSA